MTVHEAIRYRAQLRLHRASCRQPLTALYWLASWMVISEAGTGSLKRNGLLLSFIEQICSQI